MMKEVWVFNGVESRFASGVFSDRAEAEVWILQNNLAGVLTLYPVNKGIYQWAIEEGFYTPKQDSENAAEFIQKFSSASQEHYHYENGILEN